MPQTHGAPRDGRGRQRPRRRRRPARHLPPADDERARSQPGRRAPQGAQRVQAPTRASVGRQVDRRPAKPPGDAPGRGIPRQKNEGWRPVSIGKKIAHKAEAVKGGAKKTVGRVTGSWHLRAEGRGDQVKGNAKQAGAKIKDVFKH
ncbi:CsbD family protein [Streptomyces katrae]|uniref:CsbD family protein n=1 Tax=Streptomyces katrae TaxID=68223 RepID=UPI002D21C372|nr:CsbD family protein [Streptomyces katrae]